MSCGPDSSSANPGSFPQGKDPKGWKADFDWFVSNDRNVVKVLEGKHDHHERAGPDRHSTWSGITGCQVEAD